VIRDVGRRIAEIRAARGKTQEEFAEETGVTVGYVRRLEAGENLTLRSLVETANLLKVRVTELLKPPRSRKITIGRPRKFPV
jgi:transcriptional regulator with XRE-family HTH domain